jgi:hypothetical protein
MGKGVPDGMAGSSDDHKSTPHPKSRVQELKEKKNITHKNDNEHIDIKDRFIILTAY